MIIDQITLSGNDAYLRGGHGEMNLALAPGIGRSAPIGDGTVWDVSGITVTIDRDRILELLPRQTSRLLAVEVVKEMFPGLFRDPYCHRVHRLAGFEDFTRGDLTNLRAMEVEGTATLVSEGSAGNCLWRSAVYQFPQPLTFSAGAWEMPAARLTPPDAFAYKLALHWWRPGENVRTVTPQTLALAANSTPASPRFLDGVPTPAPVIAAYQVVFEAAVNHDAYLRERYAGSASDRSLGRPLLSAVNLLEVVPAAHDYYSLQEIIDDSAGHVFFDGPGAEPHRFAAQLAITATLTRGEYIKITLSRIEPQWTLLSARLKANVLLRPPAVDKEG